MAAPVRGHDQSKARVPRKSAVVHTWAGCDGQSSGVTAVDLPLAGLRVGVLHLQFLLPGASLLREHLPKESAAGTAAASQPAIPAKLGSRLDHRDCQRAYRERCRRRRVRDHTSAGRGRSGNIEEPSKKTGGSTPLAEGFQDRLRFERLQSAIRPVCILCGRSGQVGRKQS